MDRFLSSGIFDPTQKITMFNWSYRLDSRMDSIVEFEAKQHAMEQKHSRARHAWRHLADNLSKDDIKKFLGVR